LLPGRFRSRLATLPFGNPHGATLLPDAPRMCRGFFAPRRSQQIDSPSQHQLASKTIPAPSAR
jgi:hypothetical protein